MYRHLFWDMGGTLVDTYPALDAEFVRVIRGHGHDVDTATVSRWTRRSTGEAIEALAEQFGIPGDEFERANRALKDRWRSQPAPVMPGAQELMADVRAAGGLNLVVTHRERGSAESLVSGLGLEIDDLVSTSDGYPRKPDPTMYRVLLERHGLSPADCLGIGDRAIDAEAACGAGMDAAMLTSPHAAPSDVATHIVGTLDELRPLLQLGTP